MFSFHDLDSATRALMRSEIERDAARLYQSPRLSSEGRRAYRDLLLAAADDGSEDSFADALELPGRLNAEETAVRNGKTFTRKVPVNAAQTLAEGEFNRFYARAVCLRAIAQGLGQVRVYRAKPVTNPRSESELMLGRMVDAQLLLNDLRASTGVEPALGLPPGPNSGLSVELPPS